MKSFIWNYFDESISPSILFIIKESFRKLNKNFKQNYFSQYVLPFLKFLSYPHFVQLFFIISIYIIIKKKILFHSWKKGVDPIFRILRSVKRKKKKKKILKSEYKVIGVITYINFDGNFPTAKGLTHVVYANFGNALSGLFTYGANPPLRCL